MEGMEEMEERREVGKNTSRVWALLLNSVRPVTWEGCRKAEKERKKISDIK